MAPLAARRAGGTAMSDGPCPECFPWRPDARVRYRCEQHRATTPARPVPPPHPGTARLSPPPEPDPEAWDRLAEQMRSLGADPATVARVVPPVPLSRQEPHS